MLWLRSARRSDSRFVYDLAMLPEVRAVSTREELFTWEDHERWYDLRLFNSLIFIVEEVTAGGYGSVGYVRWGNGDHGLEVAIAVLPFARRRGIARSALAQSEPLVQDRWPGRDMYALVRTNNMPSWHLFAAAGYDQIGRVERMGKSHWLFCKAAPILPADASGARAEAESHSA